MTHIARDGGRGGSGPALTGNGGRGARGRARPRVLIAEDDDDLRELMVLSLAEDGYEIDEASSGHELLALLAHPSGHYDVVVTDIRMPGLSGLDVIDDLRAHRAPRDWAVGVIMLTSFPDLPTRAEAHRLQAVLLEKPLDMEELRDAVADLIELTQVGS